MISVAGLVLACCIATMILRSVKNSENDDNEESGDHQQHDGESKVAAEESDDVTVSSKSSGDHQNSLEDHV